MAAFLVFYKCAMENPLPPFNFCQIFQRSILFPPVSGVDTPDNDDGSTDVTDSDE